MRYSSSVSQSVTLFVKINFVGVKTYGQINPLLATVPLMLAIKTMLPPVPRRTIWRATAWAVMKEPVTLTPIMRSTSSALYSSAGVSCWMPAAAMRPSMRPCWLAMPSTMSLSWATSRTSTWW